MSKALDEYMADTASHIKPVSRAALRDRLERILRDPEIEVKRLTPATAERWYGELRAAGFAVDTVQNALKAARKFGAWLHKKGFVNRHPFDGLAYVGRRRRGKTQLTVDEARAFLSCALVKAETGDKMALAPVICLLLGLRNSEVLRLHGRDVDDGGRLLWVREGKTKNAERVIEVPETLRAALVARATMVGNANRLFPHLKEWLWEASHRLCKEAGVTIVGPHGLRGTHASLALAAGATAHLVAGTLGHGSTRITMAHYIAPTVASSTAMARADSLVPVPDRTRTSDHNDVN